MIARRDVVLALGAGILAPFDSFAQQQPRVWRIGYLGTAAGAYGARNAEEVRSGLRELGYVEGRNLVIEYRGADGKAERLPELAAELVRLKVDLIVAPGRQGAVAASWATRTIPIVVPASGDLVAPGLAASLARPAGNITGQIFFSEALNAKGLEVLKETIPGLTRVAFLVAPTSLSKLAADTITATARHLKMEIPQFVAQGGTDFEAAFAAMIKQRVGALTVPENALMNFNAKTMADLALKHRLPSSGNVGFAETGGMLGYGANFADMYRRSALFIDKIFKGAKPGDIPIEQASRFDFIVNMKTAKALGIKIPGSILVRATEVIE